MVVSRDDTSGKELQEAPDRPGGVGGRALLAASPFLFLLALLLLEGWIRGRF